MTSPDTSHLPPGVDTKDAAAHAAAQDAAEIDFLDLLPAAVAKKLGKAKIETLDDLKQTTQAKLSAIPRMGKKSIADVVELAKKHDIDIPKGTVKKKAKAAPKNGSNENGLSVTVTVALAGNGIDMQLCEGTVSVKKGATLYDSAMKALEHTQKVAAGLPD